MLIPPSLCISITILHFSLELKVLFAWSTYFIFFFKTPPLSSRVFCRIASFILMVFQYTSVRTQAKSTKGYGLALHGSRAHLHILMRIDMPLPCLHDLSCLFICAGFSVVIMSRYRPVPQSRWHLLCRDRKGCVFFFFLMKKKSIFFKLH